MDDSREMCLRTFEGKKDWLSIARGNSQTSLVGDLHWHARAVGGIAAYCLKGAQENTNRVPTAKFLFQQSLWECN